MSRIICAGHVNWDVTLFVDRLPEADGEAVVTEQSQAGGGSASNAAAVLAGLACDAAILGSVGTDEHGVLARRELADAGVDCRYLRETAGETAVKYLLVDEAGDVSILANDGVNEAFTADDLPGTAVRAADHLHLTGQRPATAIALAEVAAAADVPVSFDPGRRLGDRDFRAVVDAADLLFLNDREEATAREMGLLPPTDGLTVVVTCGPDGAQLRTEHRTVEHPGFDVDPVDTAGAGDAFAAGFLAAQLDGADDDRALAVGNACGALASRTTGARTYFSWSDVDALLDVGPG
ncbi:carbohydrate kinase family protein [Halobacteriales archaeon Cl-PHB]